MEKHHYFQKDNIQLLLHELEVAASTASGESVSIPITETLVQDISDHALTRREYLGLRDQLEGSELLRRDFIQLYVQKYTTNSVTSNSVTNSAGLRVDNTLGRSTRDSSKGTVFERLPQINPVLARKSCVPDIQAAQWHMDRTNAMKSRSE